MAIKNVIFDLGGVLVNIDYYRTINAFKSLGILNFEELFTQAQQSNLFDKIETGEISEKEFFAEISKYLPKNTTEKEIITAWNVMLLDFPKERLDFLLEVKEKYKTVLLSNTNTIHLQSFYQRLKDDHDLDSLEEYFQTIYLSCEMGMRKPHPEIFLKVCELEGFYPSETLFIDDSIQHVEGAKKAGLQALHLEVAKTNIIQLFHSFLR